jgi:hypothetical protein
MKTAELTGPALDWAVAKCEQGGAAYVNTHSRGRVLILADDIHPWSRGDTWKPSTDWAQGGPIIEREEISLYHEIPAMRDSIWQARPSLSAKGAGGRWGIGPTPLIAAMRCYVASKLGEEIDIPEELG